MNVLYEDGIKEWEGWKEVYYSSPRTSHLYGIMEKAYVRPKLEGMVISEINWRDLHDIVNSNHGGQKAKSLGNRVTTLRSIFQFFFGQGWCKNNPAKIIRVNRRGMDVERMMRNPKDNWTAEEVDRVREYCEENGNQFFSFAVPLAYFCGLRLSDCAVMRYNNFLVEENAIVSHNLKTGKIINYPVHHPELTSPEFVEWYELWQTNAMLSISSSSFIFPDAAQAALSKSKHARLTMAFLRMLRKLGIENKGFHMLRNRFSQNLEEKGLDIYAIQRWLAHSNRKETENYVSR